MSDARKKSIIYTRVSTDEQASRGYSLRDQEARLRDYCARTGREVAVHFQDDASAKTFDRPGFNELLGYVRRHQDVGELLIQKWDRFSRDKTGALNMIDTLDRYGVDVLAIDQPVDLSIPENHLMLAFYVTAPDVENRRRSMNTIMGTRRALREGRWCNAAPVGYKNARDERGKPVLIPSEKAPFVREAFEMAAHTDLAISEIRLRLRKKGFDYGRSKFYDMFRKHVYKGYVLIPAWKKEPEELVRGIHEPIVPPEVWDRVQEVRFGAPKQIQPKTRGGVRPELLLRGHLACPECSGGSPNVITGSVSRGNGGTYVYYHCQHCKGYRVRAEDVHAAVPGFLNGLQIDPAVADFYREIVESKAAASSADGKREADRIRLRIEKVEEKLLRTDEMFLEGKIAEDAYARLTAKLKADRAAEEDRLDQTEQEAAVSYEDVRQAADLMEALPAVWRAAVASDPMVAHDLVGSIVPEGVTFEGGSVRTAFGASIVGLFGPKTQNADPLGESASGVVAGAGFEPAIFGL